MIIQATPPQRLDGDMTPHPPPPRDRHTWVYTRRAGSSFGLGGGGGQRPKGAHDFFFLSGAHQWHSQLFGMGGGGYQCIEREKIAHRTRGSICYHNFPNILLV